MTDSTQTLDQLVTLAAAGDHDAMRTLYRRMNSTVNGWVRQSVPNPHTAEDLSQEVWIKVAQNLGRYRPGTNLIAWLMTITRNTVVDHLRTIQRRPTEVLQADHLALDRPRPGLTPHQYAERRLLAQAIEAQMEKLKPEQRRCIRLRYFDGCSPADTAQIMGKTVGAVRTLTLRSLRKLAQVLPEGDSSAELMEELLTVGVGRGNVVGVRTEIRERAQHVATR
ncbi:RNA polymerase sigma factor [Streptomyces olivaceus]|uniref:RNA polymerase sigma factor n=1 Tax=Streptomyces olivaceus TaxID=47716 RepID=UPI001CCC99BC|nr:RNA polymerase sigma factor [Streptomyces olivaceus]MBZ6253647.1 RNA polymerase sigma factor [Streptomyces olivaceus]